jgi:hypothetical protein
MGARSVNVKYPSNLDAHFVLPRSRAQLARMDALGTRGVVRRDRQDFADPLDSVHGAVIGVTPGHARGTSIHSIRGRLATRLRFRCTALSEVRILLLARRHTCGSICGKGLVACLRCGVLAMIGQLSGLLRKRIKLIADPPAPAGTAHGVRSTASARSHDGCDDNRGGRDHWWRDDDCAVGLASAVRSVVKTDAAASSHVYGHFRLKPVQTLPHDDSSYVCVKSFQPITTCLMLQACT